VLAVLVVRDEESHHGGQWAEDQAQAEGGVGGRRGGEPRSAARSSSRPVCNGRLTRLRGEVTCDRPVPPTGALAPVRGGEPRPGRGSEGESVARISLCRRLPTCGRILRPCRGRGCIVNRFARGPALFPTAQ
jgi:hypothetical protein